MALPQDIDDPKFEVVRIGGGMYRKLIIPEHLHFKTGPSRYQEQEEEVDEELDEQMTYEGDEYVLELPIAAVYHKFIVGTRARNKQKLEMESGARIVVPHRDDLRDVIWLRARQKQQIYSCKAQIELLCEREESKLEYTHFLSVPLAYDAKLRQLCDQFREDVVLQRYDGIDASIFMPSKRMHFTVCMLKLHSHASVDEMKEALKDLSARISATADYSRPQTAHLRGLHIMTDDPTNVSVVFTTDRSKELQNRMNSMADMVFDVLRARGLVSQSNLMSQRLLSSDGAHAEVKLHATLMNTKYSRSNRQDGWRGGGDEREFIDASVLMERFGQVDFGEVKLREIQLSCLDQMGDDGYYRSLCSLPLCHPTAR